MDESGSRSLDERVAQLESAVTALQCRLDEHCAAAAQVPAKPATLAAAAPRGPGLVGPAPTVVTPVAQPARRPAAPVRPTAAAADSTLKGESWLKLTGIGLVLFGVAFLFKYSIDQGWITEPVRVGCGLLLATALIAFGVRVGGRRPHFGQTLLGGGIAAYYISGFAAFQLYALVSHPVAFSYMVLVTVVAFVLSVRRRDVALSLVATAGGLGTPFLLYTGSGSLPGLIAYTCIVLSGTSAIYLFRGWRSLVWVSAVGGWLVLLASRSGLPVDLAGAAGDAWAVQLGILFGCAVFWGIPVLREVLAAGNPARWPAPALPELGEYSTLAHRHVHLLSVGTPLVALALSRSIPWGLSTPAWGWITMAGAALYAGVAWGLRRSAHHQALAYTHALAGLLLLTLGLCQVLRGQALLLGLAAEAAALHGIGRRLADRGTTLCAHLLSVVVAPWLAYRIFSPAAGAIPFANSQALTDGAIIAAFLVSSTALRAREECLIYRLAAHLALLGWVYRELARHEGGQGYISVIWGIYAVGLLVAGLRLDRHELRVAGLATLPLVVAKLFMVDLEQVQTIWRILLFLGFGGLFLVLSYYFRTLWRPTAGPSDPNGRDAGRNASQ